MRTASLLRSGTLPSLLRDSPGPSTRMRVGGGPCWSLTLATLAGVRSIAATHSERFCRVADRDREALRKTGYVYDPDRCFPNHMRTPWNPVLHLED